MSSPGCGSPQELSPPHPALLGLSPTVPTKNGREMGTNPARRDPNPLWGLGQEPSNPPEEQPQPHSTWSSLREERAAEHRDFKIFFYFILFYLGSQRPPRAESGSFRAAFQQPGTRVCLGLHPVRLGPCARCNLSSSSGPKCSPSAEVLAQRVWFGPSFHGKLNNHRRGRNGEREKKSKNPTQQLSTALPKVERTKTHFGFLSSEPELFPSRSGAAFPTTLFDFAFY